MKTPYHTGKVQIGRTYTPAMPIPDHFMGQIQTGLLGRNRIVIDTTRQERIRAIKQTVGLYAAFGAFCAVCYYFF